jgi:hypothetical protein
VTEHVGERLAARSKDLAADLRKSAENARANAPASSPEATSAPEDETKHDGGTTA